MDDSKFGKKIDFRSSNLNAKWKTFKSEFKVYQIAKKFPDMSVEEQKANMLLLLTLALT